MSYSWFQTSQTGGQPYSDTSPFSIPWWIWWKYFGVNLLTLFCKLDHFIAMQHILPILIKWSSLQKSVNKLTPKKFYEIDSRLVPIHKGNLLNNFYVSWWNVICQKCKLMKWQLVKKHVNDMASIWNNKTMITRPWMCSLVKWQVDEFASWWHVKLMKW